MKRHIVDESVTLAIEPIGEYEWFDKAKVKQIGTGRSDDFITLQGECRGKTKEEAEARARKAAADWISERDKSSGAARTSHSRRAIGYMVWRVPGQYENE